jgi:thiol-disulfide isomerase/thioredoxin
MLREIMKLNRVKWLAVFIGFAGSTTFGATLKVGDAAPKLQVAKWVQGEPVKEFERDKAYIVEFWATWCGPCRESIPHVNELYAKFKDNGLVVIGQSVWERKPEAVAPFVKKMGQQMTYRVALDTDEGTMAKTWMDAAGQDGIPAAFVVDKRGIIAWIGHPTKLKESVLEQVLAGKFDVRAATIDYEKQQKKEEQRDALWQEFQRLVRREQWEQADATLSKVEALMPEEDRDNLGTTRFQLLLNRKDYQAAYRLAERLSDAQPDDAGRQNRLAWTIATKEGLAERDLDLAEKIARRANESTQGKDAEILDTLARVLFLKGQKAEAINLQTKAVEHAEADHKRQFERNLNDYKAGRVPNEAAIASLEGQIRNNIQEKEWDKAEATLAELEKVIPAEDRGDLGMNRFRILFGRQDYKAAYKLAGELSDARQDEPMFQNQLAWEIATNDGVKERDLDLAEKIARRGNEKTQGKNAEILDTLARVLFLKGQKQSAIESQERAVDNASGSRKAQFKETLESYKQGKTPKAY